MVKAGVVRWMEQGRMMRWVEHVLWIGQEHRGMDRSGADRFADGRRLRMGLLLLFGRCLAEPIAQDVGDGKGYAGGRGGLRGGLLLRMMLMMGMMG